MVMCKPKRGATQGMHNILASRQREVESSFNCLSDVKTPAHNIIWVVEGALPLTLENSSWVKMPAADALENALVHVYPYKAGVHLFLG